MDHQRTDAPDAGFTLLEVVVAMAVFTLTLSAALAMIVNTGGVLRGNTQRVAAANLATQQLESARSLTALQIPEGTTTRTQRVGGTEYTVTQNANFVATGAGGSACTGTGDQLAYKLVTVTVTWPDMGRTKPVRADTVRALGLGANALDATRGSLAIGVVDVTGDPVPDSVVTLTPGGLSRRTGLDGCAVFTGLAPGTYSATTQRVGYVSDRNAAASTKSQGVRAGAVDRLLLPYDVAASTSVSFAPPPGHTVPAGIDVSMRTQTVSTPMVLPACSASPTTGCLTAVPGTARNLYPAVAEFWAGTCADATTPSPVSTDLAVSTPSVAVPLAGVRVRVVNALGIAVTGRAVTANHAAGQGPGACPAQQLALPATGAAGSLGALPYGTWTLTTPGALIGVQTTLGAGVTDVTLRVPL